MMASYHCRCYLYDECRSALGKNRGHKTINCLLIWVCSDTFPPWTPVSHHTLWRAQQTLQCDVIHHFSLTGMWFVFCFSFVYYSHTLAHHLIAQLVHRPQDVRLQSDHSVWLHHNLQYQKGYRTILPSLFFLAVSFLLSLTHIFMQRLSVSMLRLGTPVCVSAAMLGVIWGCGLPHFQELETVQFHLRRKRERDECR